MVVRSSCEALIERAKLTIDLILTYILARTLSASLSLFGPGLVLFTVHYLVLRGGGRELLSREHAVAYPVSPTTDHLGALLLAAGLVTLLLGITKGRAWGWSSVTTVSMFGASLVVFALFAVWQLRFDSPIVDLRTTVRRPVLTTNIASIGVGFAMFALSLIAPQILELPTETGYGLGMSMLEAGLWMAPGGLAMMVTAPVAARVMSVRGPRFTLFVGCVVITSSYLGGIWLLGGGPQVLALNVLVSIGVGFAYASMPTLINAAVPVSETAAANGINALARSLGTSISSAVIGAVLAGLVMQVGGHDVPTLAAFQVALLVAAGVAALAAVLALLIPAAPQDVTDRSASSPLASGSARR